MADNKRKETSQTADIREYLELLKELNETEKAQVKGIMIGMQMTKQQLAAQGA